MTAQMHVIETNRPSMDWLAPSGERYASPRLLRRACGIDTLLAQDLHRDVPVVIKGVDAAVLTPAAQARCEYEVSAVGRELGLELVAGDRGPCLVRPYIPGVSLAERLKRGPLGVAAAIRLALDVLGVVVQAHQAGVVHQDIKPSNIIIGPAGSAALVDFVLRRSGQFSKGEIALGRLHYQAPEQLGIIHRGVDARADLYVVGLVLHEAITGTPPFSGGSVTETLRKHLTERPAPLRELDPEVPPALEQIVGLLLRKDPRDRYQRAEGALADLSDLADALARGQHSPALVVGSRDRRSTLTEPTFVERGDELAVAARVLDEGRTGRGGLLVVDGASGAGKTWFLEELAQRATRQGAWVIRTQGLDRMPPWPLQTLSPVGVQAAAAVEGDPALRGRVLSLGPAVPESLPALQGPLGGGQGQLAAVDGRSELGSVATLGKLIDALGAPDQPAVVIVDDAQWADGATLRVIERWCAEPQESGSRFTVVVLAQRPEEVLPDHPSLSSQAVARIVLAPFDQRQVRQQLASMAGQLPDEVVTAIAHHSSGNPFLVTALIEGLVEAHTLAAGEWGWELRADAQAQLQVSSTMADMLTARLGGLPTNMMRLLTFGAILGRRFDAVLAGALGGISPTEAIRLAESCRGRLVWAGAAEGTYSFLHDRIRELMLSRLMPEEQQRLHGEAARRIQAADPHRVFDLAYHYEAANEPKRALPFAIEAAEQARAQLDLALAERQFRLAEGSAGDADSATRYRVARGLGEVLLLRNNHEEARIQLERARHLAPDRESRFQVEELFCQLEFQSGRLKEACTHGEAALRLLGRKVPAHDVECVTLASWELLVQVLHSFFPSLLVHRRPLSRADEDMLAIRMFYAIGGPYFFSRGIKWAVWAHLRNLNLAERYPPTGELGRAMGMHGARVASFPRFFPRGLAYTRRAIELCQEHKDLLGLGRAHLFHGMVLHFCGRFSESHVACQESVRVFDRVGNRWESNTALCFAAKSLYLAGDLEAALRTAQGLWQRANEVEGVHPRAWSLNVWAQVTDGEVPEHLFARASQDEAHVQSAVVLAQARALCLLRQGRYEEAEQLTRAAIRRVDTEIGVFHDQNCPLLAHHVTVLRRLAERTPLTHPRRRQALLKRARRVARRAVKVARKFQNNLPHALREAAVVAAMVGNEREARRLLDEAIAVATRRDMPYELALSREARGEVGSALGWEGAAQELSRARRELQRRRRAVKAAAAGLMERVPVHASPSLLDRFRTLMEVGRTITSALDSESVYKALVRAAVDLLRPERCTLMASSGQGRAGELCHVAGEVDDVAAQVMGRAAVERARPLLGPSRTAPPEADEALRRAAVRSALALPIVVRKEVLAVLYLAHGEIADLFGEEELGIAEFLAALAGAALENAEGFTRVQTLSQELEARVDERTQELERANQELVDSLDRLRDSQSQLLQAGRMAAVGSLVAGLSHELNNPIAIIVGYVDGLLQLQLDDPRLNAAFAAIDRQAHRCAALVKALLTFARSKPESREVMSPGALVESVMALVVGQSRTLSLQIEATVEEGLPELAVCPQDIESAMLNLLTNAMDASPRGGRVDLTARTLAKNGRDGVEFTVRDEGKGIPPEVLPHIFDPFFTTKPVGQGTGLGLSLARQIVEAHDGTMQVQSAPGGGTTMSFWLPAARALN